MLLLEHPPTITLGRRTEEGEVHVPDGADGRRRRGRPRRQVDLPRARAARLLPDPRPDAARPGREEVLPRPRGGADPHDRARSASTSTRIEGLTGVWLESPPRKIASIGIHLSKWVSTHGYALNVDLDPAPFTDWITACGLDGYQFTSMARELGRPVSVDDVRPAAAQALADVFGFAFEELPSGDPGLWASRVHEQLAP